MEKNSQIKIRKLELCGMQLYTHKAQSANFEVEIETIIQSETEFYTIASPAEAECGLRNSIPPEPEPNPQLPQNESNFEIKYFAFILILVFSNKKKEKISKEEEFQILMIMNE